MKKGKSGAKRFWAIWENIGVLFIFAVVLAVFTLINPQLGAPAQLLNVLLRSTWVAVAAAGMTYAICSGGFDLSVGSIMSLAGCMMAKLIMENGLPTFAAIAITLAMAVVCGLVNGLLITKLKIQPFVATLATMLIYDGVTQTYTGNIGTFIATEKYSVLSVIGRSSFLGIPIKIWIMAAVFLLLFWVYKKTTFGIKVRAVGSNEAATRTSGINVDGTLIKVYVLTAVTAALAAILYTATVQSASPDAGDGFELDAITAVVLGGTALSGGKGNLFGTLVGAVLVQYVTMCMNFLGAPEAMHVIITGVVLVFALSISGIRIITQKKEA
ncbi:MAG: ABC transporter permease [Lachnospiraceae bacterium]|nr:ABC transporter permease [Lachnospiraceae bacterium]